MYAVPVLTSSSQTTTEALPSYNNLLPSTRVVGISLRMKTISTHVFVELVLSLQVPKPVRHVASTDAVVKGVSLPRTQNTAL